MSARTSWLGSLGGKIFGLAGRRRADAEAEERDAPYRAIFEDAHTAMILVDPDNGAIVDANACAAAFYGRSREDLRRMRIFDINPLPPEEIREGMSRARCGAQGVFAYQHQKADGRLRDVEIHSGPIGLKDRTVLYSIVHDVTDRIRAEKEAGHAQAELTRLLEEAGDSRRALLSLVEDQKIKDQALDRERTLLRMVIDHAPDGIALKDDQLRLRLANRAYLDALGAAEEVEALGKTDADFFPPETAAWLMDRDHAVLESGTAVLNREETLRRRNGTERAVLTSRLPLRDADGRVTGILDISRDVTERKELEDQIRHAQKMESVGRLAGGIAHDFNNMLQSILGNTELALEQADPQSLLHEDLVEIRNAARRSTEMTGKLLAFARRQSSVPETLDLNEAIQETLPILGRLIGEDIELAWRPGRDLWPVRLDPSQLDQVLTNLAVNARDAITGVGTLSLETENVTLDEAFCEAHIDAAPGNFVRLTVGDTGCGMSREVKAHLFEPFFTTKEKGKGTGLGLATLYGIVRQNGGFIHVYSEPGLGSTFRVFLPRTRTLDEGVEPAAEGMPAGGTETLLIVEDEATILRLAQRILGQYGYTVLAAETPAKALALLDEHPETIDLLLTDVIMPGMNGRELAERIGEIRPGIRVLYMSGYTSNLISKDGVLGRDIHFLPKPFSSRTLAAEVRRVLDG